VLPVGAVGSPAYVESKLHQPVGQLAADVLSSLKRSGE